MSDDYLILTLGNNSIVGIYAILIFRGVHASRVQVRASRLNLGPRGKAPEDWRIPRRFAFSMSHRGRAAFWTAAALRRFFHHEYFSI
jgi:hypothetical protein